MSASNTLENSILELLFKNTDFAGIGDAGGLLKSATAGSLYVSLHTGDPGEAGDQTTSETAYTSYARVAVVRSAVGWTVTTNTVVNAAAVEFPKCTGLTATITHFGIGTAASAAGKLLYSAALTAPLDVSTGIIPRFAAGQLQVSTD